MDNIEIKEEPDNDYSLPVKGNATSFPDDEDESEDVEPKTELADEDAMLSCQLCGHMTETTEEMNDHMLVHMDETPPTEKGLVQVDDLLQGKGIKDESYVADLMMEKRDLNTLVMTERKRGRQSVVKIQSKLGIVFYTNLPPGGVKRESGSSADKDSYFFCLTCGYVSGDRDEVKEHCDETHED